MLDSPLNWESLPLAAAVVVSLAAVALPRRRRSLAAVAASCFWLALALLVWHLLADHFHVRYVWLYSGPALPWYLKAANVWGGDQGTLLFIASALMGVAVAMRNRNGWALPGVLLFAAAFGVAALIWNPFTPTPAAQLEALPYRGMNAHLMVIWMALHPPLLFIAYALLMAPAGAAFGGLAGASDDFKPVVDRYFRWGWLLLTTGIAFGMWWAFKDYTFGQAWHWDPVQTSVFAVWALATAVLHGLRRYRPETAYARLLPLLCLLTTTALLVSMAVTRNDLLQSSHRYVGETSVPFFGVLIVVVLAAALIGAALSLRRRSPRRLRAPLDRWTLVAIALFCVSALLALLMLGHALMAAWLEWPRPADTKPFFEMLLRWSASDEVAALRRVFESWDVDGFALNRALAPLGVALAVVGGHVFLSLTVRRRFAWIGTCAALGAALLVPYLWQPLDELFTGAGMTSQKTVAIFYWLDSLLAAACYFLLAAVAWLLMRFRRRRSTWGLRFALPVALVHVGAMVALVAIVFATVLDRYVRAEISFADIVERPQTVPGGFTIVVDTERIEWRADGGRRVADAAGFQAVARVSLTLDGEAPASSRIDGRVLYRDARMTPSGLGSVRELCRILDYRYARYLDDGNSRLDPFIYRGWWRDVQVWIPPAGFEETEDGVTFKDADALVVIRIFPFMSWLWIGLAVVVLSSLVLTLDARKNLFRGRRS